MKPGWKPGVRSRRDQLDEARRLGIAVEPVRRTGEVIVKCHCGAHTPVRLNNRRKDGSVAIESMLADHRSAQERLTIGAKGNQNHA